MEVVLGGIRHTIAVVNIYNWLKIASGSKPLCSVRIHLVSVPVCEHPLHALI